MHVFPFLLLSALTALVPQRSTSVAGYDLGARVVSDVPGRIMACRYYKWPSDPGPHVCHIWSAARVSLAAVVFVDETDSGWQQQAFDTPVTVAAGTTWTVGVNTTAGFYYPILPTGFATPLVDDHLTFLRGAWTTSTGTYPANETSGNYFRDVVFIPDLVPTITVGADAGGGFLAKLQNFQPGSYRLAVTMTDAAGTVTTSASPITIQPPPTTLADLQLLKPVDLNYLGAVRVPQGAVGGSSFDYGGGPLAFNKNSLFVVGHAQQQQVAEVSLPPPVNSKRLADLPTATVLQPFSDATEGRLRSVESDQSQPVSVSGLLAYKGQLYLAGSVFYDGNGSQRTSHFTRSLDLSVKGAVRGPYQVGNIGAGFVSGYFGTIPDAWQAALGGPVLNGNCCLSIISRTSYGPAAFAIDPSKLGTADPLPAQPLVYYTGDHPLGPYSGDSTLFNLTSIVTGVVFPEGTRSVLFFGRHGLGKNCYGPGTSDITQGGKPIGPDFWCYDPTSSAKGGHGYPYAYYVWAYDALDFAAVKVGTKQPWDVKPYAVWSLDLPIGGGAFLLGAAYDAATGRIFVSQAKADGDNPVIHVYSVTP